MAEPEGLRKHAQGMFFVLALLGSLTSLAPKSAAADLSNKASFTDPTTAIPKRPHKGGRFGMAEDWGQVSKCLLRN